MVRVAHIEEVQPAGSALPGLAPRGLEGVAVAETSVGDVRGEEGFFHYRGYNATELARRCSFEQVWHLLAEGELPDEAQLKAFTKLAVAARSVPDEVADLLPRIAALPGYTPLMALRSAVSLTGAALEQKPTLDIPPEEVRKECLKMAAIVPVLLMRLHRHHLGLEPVEPDPDLGYAGSYIQMLTGERPHAREIRALEQYLILTMDHGFNSSTFTARVITSTGSDIGSALTGAIGALAGPLHGGAPSRALAMLDAIGTPDKAEEYLRREISSGERLMGFGHRVYKTDDPRSTLLQGGRDRAWRPAGRIRGPGGADGAARPQRAQAGPAPLHERRVLRGRGDEQRRHSSGHVHPDLRIEPHRRVDRGDRRAGSQQPPHPSLGAVRRPAAAAPLAGRLWGGAQQC